MRWLYDSVGSLPVPTPSPSPLLQEYTVEFTVQTTTLHEVVHNIKKNLRMNVNLQRSSVSVGKHIPGVQGSSSHRGHHLLQCIPN